MEKKPSKNFSLEAEQSVIGGLILKNDTLTDVSNVLSLDDFYDKRHQLLFKAIQNLATQEQPFDPVTLSEQLEKDGTFDAIGGGEYLGLLAGNTPSAANIMAYARIVKEKFLNRQLDDAYNRRAKGCIISSIEEQLDLIKNPQAANYMSGLELMNKELPEILWVIHGIIPKATRNLLVARPKTGKTYLALQWAIAVAAGFLVFGKYAVTQGQVLYMALEENEIRLKKTLDEVLTGYGIPMPKDFYYKTDCPPIDQGGLAHITKWIEDMPNPVLICVDVLKRFRAVNEGKNKGIYDADYEAVLELKAIAEKYNVAFLITHHPNKRVANSVSHIQDTVSGSHGLTGGVDNYMIMTNPNGRGKQIAELYKDGRYYGNEHSGTMYLTRREEDGGNGTTWFETTQESTQGDERREVLQLMRDGYNMAKDIAEVLDKDRRAVSKLLYTMMKSEPPLVERTGRGIFKLLLGGENELDNCNLESQPDNEKSGLLGLLEEQQNSVYSVYSDDKSLDNKELDNMSSVSDYSESKPSKPVEKVVYSDGLLCSDDKSDSYNEVNQVNRHMYTQSKPLNGEFVPLNKFLTIKRHRDLGLDEFFQNKAMVRGTVYDHYYVMFVRAFKNEYKRNAGRVICKIVNEMGKGYPFSQAMTKILDSREILKEVRYGWTKIKTRLSDQYGEDELEAALKELIEAGFVEHNVQTHTLKFVD